MDVSKKDREATEQRHHDERGGRDPRLPDTARFRCPRGGAPEVVTAERRKWRHAARRRLAMAMGGGGGGGGAGREQADSVLFRRGTGQVRTRPRLPSHRRPVRAESACVRALGPRTRPDLRCRLSVGPWCTWSLGARTRGRGLPLLPRPRWAP